MRHRRVPPLVLVLLCAGTVAIGADQTDDYVKAEMQRQHIPGLSLAVVKDGKIIKAGGYGLADMKLKTPATPSTVYKIGSVSKQFIATGIMLLVQDRQLGLDDPIRQYLEGTPAAWNGITIRHLLTHTSGLVREVPGYDPFKIQKDADVIEAAYRVPLNSAPGARYEYSNAGYFALAEIIRKVSHRPWNEYLSERVFKPAGMNTTHPTNTTEAVSDRAAGYSDNDKLRDAVVWLALRPSGAFLSTVLDLAKWDAALYTDTVLRDASRREMWTPVPLNNSGFYPYGFGWELDSLNGHRQVHHGGGVPGFLSEFARYVDDRLTVIVLMNLDDADVEKIANGVAGFFLPGPVPARDSKDTRQTPH
ncbi:MAG: serine hydrolase domain-containing protein [Acidobacteriota bacterium]